MIVRRRASDLMTTVRLADRRESGVTVRRAVSLGTVRVAAVQVRSASGAIVRRAVISGIVLRAPQQAATLK